MALTGIGLQGVSGVGGVLLTPDTKTPRGLEDSGAAWVGRGGRVRCPRAPGCGTRRKIDATARARGSLCHRAPAPPTVGCGAAVGGSRYRGPTMSTGPATRPPASDPESDPGSAARSGPPVRSAASALSRRLAAAAAGGGDAGAGAAVRRDTGRPDPADDPLLEGMNPPQREAVVHTGSPLLIVAGAGSGKTRVLTHRIAWQMRHQGVGPGQFMAITFTNKAAAEMRERVAALVGRRANAMWVSTFHSMCVRILRREYRHLGLQLHVLDLRRGRLAAAGRHGRPRARPRRQEVLAPRAAGAHLGVEERAGLADRGRRRRRHRGGEAHRRGLHRLPGPPAAVELPRLRRPHRPHGRPAHPLPGRRRVLPPPVPAHPGRRVPGHQPRPVHAGPGAGGGQRRRLGEARGAVRGGRRRPVDLRLPRRHDPQHRRVRARLPRGAHDPAGAELPLHPAHPQRRQRRHQPQRRAAGQAAVDRRRRRRAGRRLRGRQRARRGRVRRLARSTGSSTPARSASARSRCSTAPTASPVSSRTCSSASGCPYKIVGGVRFYERREVRDAMAYLKVLSNPEDTVSLRRILNVPKRGIGDRAEAVVADAADRERITFAAALRRRRGGRGPRARDALAAQHRRLRRDDGRARRHRGGRRVGRRGARRDPRPLGLPRGARGLGGPAGAVAPREPPGARQRRARVRPGRPQRRGARGGAGGRGAATAERTPAEDRGTGDGSPSRARSRRSSSACRWWPTPTRSPTAATAWSR